MGFIHTEFEADMSGTREKIVLELRKTNKTRGRFGEPEKVIRKSNMFVGGHLWWVSNVNSNLCFQIFETLWFSGNFAGQRINRFVFNLTSVGRFGTPFHQSLYL